MFAKSLASAASRKMFARPSFMNVAARGVYTAETQPYVFINQHTKVICQGMTGKHVSSLLTEDETHEHILQFVLICIGNLPH